MKIHSVRTRKGNKYGKKRRKRLGYIFHGGGFTDVQSSHASYRLSLLVNLLTRTVLSLPFLRKGESGGSKQRRTRCSSRPNCPFDASLFKFMTRRTFARLRNIARYWLEFSRANIPLEKYHRSPFSSLLFDVAK